MFPGCIDPSRTRNRHGTPWRGRQSTRRSWRTRSPAPEFPGTPPRIRGGKRRVPDKRDRCKTRNFPCSRGQPPAVEPAARRISRRYAGGRSVRPCRRAMRSRCRRSTPCSDCRCHPCRRSARAGRWRQPRVRLSPVGRCGASSFEGFQPVSRPPVHRRCVEDPLQSVEDQLQPELELLQSVVAPRDHLLRHAV